MNNEMKLRTELYQKLEKEFNDFIEELKSERPEVIMERAYEKVMKEETYVMFYPETEKFDISQIRALNKTDRPLQELYDGWMDCDVNLNQLYEDNIYDTLEDLKLKQKEEKALKNSKER